MPSTTMLIMPGRYIREGILDSERVCNLSTKEKPTAELFFFRLLLVVDDYGRFEARTQLLKAKCFPCHYNIDKTDILNFLKACASQRLLDMYTVNSKWYLQVYNFKQRTRGASKYPNPPQKKAPNNG